MPDSNLNIVSFDVPFPANYGGVIDVYYKILALKNAGIKVYLHCFAYGRRPAAELEAVCEKVYYYPRKTGLKANLSLKPYIVNSRKSETLIQNLLQNKYPILFEGLHSCFYLNDARLKERFLIYRESNIEHHYYYHLFASERNILSKVFFLVEHWRLRRYQKVLQRANLMLVVSQSDTQYLREHFPDNHVEYLPSFHPNNNFAVFPGKGNYVLYHGKLSVTENYKAAEYLLSNVFASSGHKLIIAGMDPPPHLVELCKKYPNVSLFPNPDDSTLFVLIQNAQVNILITFQATGLKLKLLNTLYKGRFCLVNPAMVQGTGLEALCTVADGAEAMKRELDSLFTKDFDMREVEQRRRLLEQNYSNIKNAARIIKWVF